MTSPPTQVLTTSKHALHVVALRLEVVGGPDAGKAIAGSDEITIGTDAANTLVLVDPAVSRMHVLLRPQPQGWMIRDLGSTNGTALDGVRITEAFAVAGQTIVIGATSIAVTTPGTVDQHALSIDPAWGQALGRSASMRRLFAVLPKISAAEAVVLLEGETGTGKTLLAKAIHAHSPRHAGPFVVVDCGAIAPTLIESELFGHEKGAFTGATEQRLGVFEIASGGTLFFDELGELPLELQPKLLRALEERSIRRVGGATTVDLDVRVIAATNRELRQEVNRGAFRSDLYYRLNTIKIRVPPLRERREDIAILAEHFWRTYAPDDRPLPDDLLDQLLRREWPGNVRELRSAVERAVLLGDPGTDDEPSSPSQEAELVPGQSFRVAKEHAIARWERSYVRQLVDGAGGNVSRAARAARMDRNHLSDLVRRHGSPGNDNDD